MTMRRAQEKNFAYRKLEACVWAFAQLHEGSLISQKCTMQVLATMRLLCQLQVREKRVVVSRCMTHFQYNAILTTTSAIFMSCYVDVLDAATVQDVKAVVEFVITQCIGGGERDLTVANKDFRLVLTTVLRDVAMVGF